MSAKSGNPPREGSPGVSLRSPAVLGTRSGPQWWPRGRPIAAPRQPLAFQPHMHLKAGALLRVAEQAEQVFGLRIAAPKTLPMSTLLEPIAIPLPMLEAAPVA